MKKRKFTSVETEEKFHSRWQIYGDSGGLKRSHKQLLDHKIGSDGPLQATGALRNCPDY